MAQKLTVAERNRLANVYKGEADKFGIGSPYRINEYIGFRFLGKTQEQALAAVRDQRPPARR
jgi:hypothetical protein